MFRFHGKTEGSVDAPTNVIESSVEGASKYFSDIKRINTEVFPHDAFDDVEIKESLEHPQSVLAVVKSRDEVVGYGLAVPTNKPHTAHIVSQALLPEFQGRGIVAALSQALEGELKEKGILFITREAKVSGGYAEKVRKAYEGRILAEENTENKVGEAVAFTIEL